MRFQRLAPDHLPQQVSLFSPQRVSPFVRTRTTTIDRQTSLLAGSDRRVLGVRHEAYPRARCHRTPRPRGTLARRTVDGSGTLCRTRLSLLEVVGFGLITCEEVGVVKSPYPFRRSTQCCYCPQDSGRSAGGSARG